MSRAGKVSIDNSVTPMTMIMCLVTSISGASLVFDSVGRDHVGSYLCIASNGVPPSVSKRVDLRVQCKENVLPLFNT